VFSWLVRSTPPIEEPTTKKMGVRMNNTTIITPKKVFKKERKKKKEFCSCISLLDNIAKKTPM
jgi:hypothetical protein